MRKFIQTIKVAVLCSLLLHSSGHAERQQQSNTPAQNALHYITSLFTLDMNGVLATIHPEAINELNQDFLSDLKQAEASGFPYSFLISQGIDYTPEELKTMRQDELFTILVQSSASEYRNLRKVNFSINHSTMLSQDSAIVSIKVGQTKHVLKLEMKQENEQWLVIRSLLDTKKVSI